MQKKYILIIFIFIISTQMYISTCINCNYLFEQLVYGRTIFYYSRLQLYDYEKMYELKFETYLLKNKKKCINCLIDKLGIESTNYDETIIDVSGIAFFYLEDLLLKTSEVSVSKYIYTKLLDKANKTDNVFLKSKIICLLRSYLDETNYLRFLENYIDDNRKIRTKLNFFSFGEGHGIYDFKERICDLIIIKIINIIKKHISIELKIELSDFRNLTYKERDEYIEKFKSFFKKNRNIIIKKLEKDKTSQ